MIDPAHAAATEQPGDNPARDAASHGTNGSIVRNAVVLPAAVGLNLEILHLGHTVRTLRVEADPGDFAMLQKLMRDAIRRMGTSAGAVDDYEMNVSTVVDGELVTTVVMA
ncbi:hypothetical protein AOZ06_05330 [Kibdelosporangium phytohabitans]|uniref:Uncharacterized protein n=1 Tax=Kibdelosporangium phytohabitans TaxID=860235 RepID=A0A0N9HPF8_9PSEU|nr:hypothetical protein AOZ06_05330 [Kibdelosporangium phytohabitans]